MRIEEIDREHLEVIYPKTGKPMCMCLFCQTGDPVHTYAELLLQYESDEKRDILAMMLHFIRMHKAYEQAQRDVTMMLTTIGTCAIFAEPT